MSIGGELYGDHAARVFFGDQAVHVPAFFYVQDQGPGIVSFVGSSMTPGQVHPLRFGAPHWDRNRDYRDTDGYRAHHLVVGEIIARPHIVIGTSALMGHGLGGLLTSAPDVEELMADGRGELVAGTSAQLAEIVHRSRTMPWRAER